MRVRPRARLMAVGIPTATMADIAFLLIIFFMVTTAYSLDRSPMQLPRTVEQTPVARDAAVIAVQADGSVRFSAGDAPTAAVPSAEALDAAIRAAVASDSGRQFVIKADRNVRYRVVDGILERLRRAGARNVALLTRPEARL